jgi:hypothetical protein
MTIKPEMVHRVMVYAMIRPSTLIVVDNSLSGINKSVPKPL